MKSMKKLLALIVSFLIVGSLALPSMAAETTYDLFVENDAEDHVYDAYQIFKGKLSEDELTLTNVAWGSSVSDAAALLTALITDTEEIEIGNTITTLQTVFADVAASTASVDKKAELVAAELAEVSDNSAVLDRFAEVVGAVVRDTDGSFDSHEYLGAATASSATQSTNSESKKGYAISGLPAGYYLIKDRDETMENVDDFYTKYLVRVVRSENIAIKGDSVSVIKGVSDTVDGEYGDCVDSSINSEVFYQWIGSLPANLSSYKEYNYKFLDTMSKGMDFIEYKQVYLAEDDGTPVYVLMDKTDDKTDNDTLPAGIVETAPVAVGNNWEFSLEFTNLLALYEELDADHNVVVTYSCRVTRDALVAISNLNEVKVEYDNNPNDEGTGVTVTDAAHVFIFRLDVDKYDATDSSVKLEGVQFVLSTGTGADVKYAQVVTAKMVADGETINGKTLTADDIGKVYGFTAVRADATVLTTAADGSIHVIGLDKGTYYMEEIVTNDGYNLLDEPVEIEIDPTYTVSGKACTITLIYSVGNDEQGANSLIGISNSQGSRLPSTGGIGTTLFYILGGLLVVGAIVILVAKKRMSAEKK